MIGFGCWTLFLLFYCVNPLPFIPYSDLSRKAAPLPAVCFGLSLACFRALSEHIWTSHGSRARPAAWDSGAWVASPPMAQVLGEDSRFPLLRTQAPARPVGARQPLGAQDLRLIVWHFGVLRFTCGPCFSANEGDLCRFLERLALWLPLFSRTLPLISICLRDPKRGPLPPSLSETAGLCLAAPQPRRSLEFKAGTNAEGSWHAARPRAPVPGRPASENVTHGVSASHFCGRWCSATTAGLGSLSMTDILSLSL